MAYAANAMCATSHPTAAVVALDILRSGGNAIDAAVAGAAVLSFCEPMMCGLGGDAFALVTFDGGKGPTIALNGSGKAPNAADAARLRAEGKTAIGTDTVDAITMPGAMSAFDRLVRDWGKLDMATVLAPAIHYAETGVPVTPRTALDWRDYQGRLSGDARRHFLRDGQAFRTGERFRAPPQAEALRLIAKQGVDAFYRGEIMDDMLSSLRELGGVHSADDFAGVSSEEITPVSTTYRNRRLVELPPNTQGPTALLISAILERFDLGKLDPGGAERVHIEAEATRLAYEARDRLLADAAHDAGSMALLDEKSVDALAARIDPRRVCTSRARPVAAIHRDTVHICVVDQDRIAISLIYSTFWPFGSGLASRKFGIPFQNRGAGFSLEAGHPNELQGGKRPLHTLIPALLEAPGEYLMPFGVMGGPYQACGHAHLVSNLVDFGMDIQAAIDAPRSFADPFSGELSLESAFSDKVAAELVEMGHKVSRPSVGMGGAQAIQIDLKNDILLGGTDPRKDGVALGI